MLWPDVGRVGPIVVAQLETDASSGGALCVDGVERTLSSSGGKGVPGAADDSAACAANDCVASDGRPKLRVAAAGVKASESMLRPEAADRAVSSSGGRDDLSLRCECSSLELAEPLDTSSGGSSESMELCDSITSLFVRKEHGEVGHFVGAARKWQPAPWPATPVQLAWFSRLNRVETLVAASLGGACAT